MRNRVLVVEDDQDLAELLLFNLKSAGFSTSTASNGVEALQSSAPAAEEEAADR